MHTEACKAISHMTDACRVNFHSQRGASLSISSQGPLHICAWLACHQLSRPLPTLYAEILILAAKLAAAGLLRLNASFLLYDSPPPTIR